MVPGPIVVGVDFSAAAGRAHREARGLAERLGVPLELIHVREDRGGRGWDPDEGARSWLEREGLSPDDLQTRRGVPWLELVRFASATRVDLLVLGTHGLSGAQPLALGSTASRVVLSSLRPVLLVGERDGFGGSDRSVVAGSSRTVGDSTGGLSGAPIHQTWRLT